MMVSLCLQPTSIRHQKKQKKQTSCLHLMTVFMKMAALRAVLTLVLP